MNVSLFPLAHAADGGPAPASDLYSTLVMLVGFVAIFYFMIWRPQSKRAKEHRELIASLAKGDEVVTSGGLAGYVTKVDGEYIKVKVADGVEVRFHRSAVTSSLIKGTLKALDE